MNRRRDTVKLHVTPDLQSPYLVAAWSGMGAVALLAINYLRQELNAELLGEIDPHSFYDPSQILIKEGIIQTLEYPESKFYFCGQGQTHELILFIGTQQPNGAYEMALQILAVAKRFDVQRIYTAAALPTLTHHSKEPEVWCTATHRDLVAEAQVHGVKVMQHGTIAGLNGLLLAVAMEHDIDGLCLLGEIPIYATQTINPKASRAVLSVLTRMLGVEIDMTKLGLWAEDLGPQMDKLYSILPDEIKEAITNQQETEASHAYGIRNAEETFVADETFFQEIERFLAQHWRPDSDTKDDQDQDKQSL